MAMALSRNVLKLLLGLAAILAAGVSHAEDKLTAEAVKALLTDKTVHARHEKQKYNFVNYFAQDGSVKQLSESGEKKNGTWRVESDGALCVAWDGDADTSCGSVIALGDGKYKRMRLNPRNIMAPAVHAVTFERVESGNPQGL